jgi:hypothetical protein
MRILGSAGSIGCRRRSSFANAFNGNLVGNAFGASGVVEPTKNYEWIAASDVIIHF